MSDWTGEELAALAAAGDYSNPDYTESPDETARRWRAPKGSDMQPEIKYPNVHVQLTGNNGNVFVVMGAVRSALRTAGVPADEIAKYTAESTAGDYDNALRTAMAWVTVS